MKALILAAGFGTRLLPFTKNIPKALFPVAGRPLLEIIILSLQNAGCKAVIINTHHLYKKIDSYLARQKYAMTLTPDSSLRKSSKNELRRLTKNN